MHHALGTLPGPARRVEAAASLVVADRAAA
jgi:hypothetical protein